MGSPTVVVSQVEARVTEQADSWGSRDLSQSGTGAGAGWGPREAASLLLRTSEGHHHGRMSSLYSVFERRGDTHTCSQGKCGPATTDTKVMEKPHRELKAPQRPDLGEEHKAQVTACHGASEDKGIARPDRGSQGRLRQLLVWEWAASAGVRGA